MLIFSRRRKSAICHHLDCSLHIYSSFSTRGSHSMGFNASFIQDVSNCLASGRRLLKDIETRHRERFICLVFVENVQDCLRRINRKRFPRVRDYRRSFWINLCGDTFGVCQKIADARTHVQYTHMCTHTHAHI